MAPFWTKVLALMAVVLPSLLLLQTSTVEAVDIVGYSNNGACNSGNVIGCYDVGNQVCCDFSSGEGALEIVNLLEGETAYIFTGGGCATQIATIQGPATECYYADAFSGAYWNYN